MNEELLVTAAQASVAFTRMRGVKVSRNTIHNWVNRYEIAERDKLGARGAARYRLGDLMEAEKRARANVSSAGRGRPLAA